eukprot:3453682-Amphidinium_carterae.1
MEKRLQAMRCGGRAMTVFSAFDVSIVPTLDQSPRARLGMASIVMEAYSTSSGRGTGQPSPCRRPR